MLQDDADNRKMIDEIANIKAAYSVSKKYWELEEIFDFMYVYLWNFVCILSNFLIMSDINFYSYHNLAIL